MVATEVEKEEVDSDKKEKPPDPTHEELKEMFGFTNLSMHHSNGDDVANFGFCQVGTHTNEVPMLNPTTPGLDYKDEATTSAVADNSMKTGLTFANIVHGNHPSKLVARVNPVIYAQNKNFPQKKQVARFTLARWKLY